MLHLQPEYMMEKTGYVRRVPQIQGSRGTMVRWDLNNAKFLQVTDYNSVKDHLKPYADLRLQLGLAHLLIPDVLVFPRDCAAFSIEPKESTYMPSRVY
ncbi:hypothetical protein MT325_m113L [Paramecium bursaria chlorella virus MT325]|uniref:Uncharacterized protein m113L n=1 Tax=Paramecium bursaria Chlorella virus MT325 TaxID=346932 RepID=A7ITJ3_PBCVM|nr:hypothetical protein MT325_m113L [Paramecium bursaria chlorella virus MT325]